jgi:F-type H+-transporting ATPase subunit delta
VSDSDIITGEAPARYAGAILDLAEESKSLKTVEKDLKTLKKMFASNADLRQMAASPVFATEDKVAALTAIAKKAKIGKLVTNFIGIAAQNRRAEEIPAMITAFETELASRRQTQVAKVTSAKKLTAAQLTKLKAELKKSLGRTVSIETDIDPELLGGFVVKIGSRLYDSSLKTKIEDLKLALKEA